MDDHPATEPRYTLDEARALLAAQDCASEGHSLNGVRTAGGDTLWVYCTRCSVRFVPVEAPAGQ